jgi:hypothetical protein
MFKIFNYFNKTIHVILIGYLKCYSLEVVKKTPILESFVKFLLKTENNNKFLFLTLVLHSNIDQCLWHYTFH